MPRLNAGYLCQGCVSVISGRPGDNPPPLRTRSFVCDDTGIHILDRAGWWELLQSAPSEPIVASWAITRKKHHALHAGWSMDGTWHVGTDTGQAVWEHDNDVMDACLELRRAGAGKAQIASGRYSVNIDPTVVDRCERVLVTMRPLPSGWMLDLLVHALPPLPKKLTKPPRETMPLPQPDTAAIEVLQTLAKGSNVRRTEGLKFWGGYLLSRVRRFARLPLPDLVSRLSDELDTDVYATASAGALVRDMDMETQTSVSDALKARPTLLVSLTYDALKK